MNKKEVLEIRKQFVRENNIISKIVSCIVDEDKNIKSIQKNIFYSLDEEEQRKYETIFKKALSGDIGRNLINFELAKDNEDKIKFEKLYDFRESSLNDDEKIKEFITRIINNYSYKDKYAIILVDIYYDVPARTKDKKVLEYDFNETYKAILTCICPLKLSKSSLVYNSQLDIFENKKGDLFLDLPMNAFLYPAFNQRANDIYNLLYYSKSLEDLQLEFVKEIFTDAEIKNPKEQKMDFFEYVEKAGDKDFGINEVKEIYANVNEMYSNNDEKENSLVLEKKDLEKVLIDAGFNKEKVEEASKTLDEDFLVFARNIVGDKKLEINKDGINIKVSMENIHLIESRIIDNKKYLLISLDKDVKINGIKVNGI